MDKDLGAVTFGKKRAQNLRSKLGSDEALKDHMQRLGAGKKLS
jgi:hypothetical protein